MSLNLSFLKLMLFPVVFSTLTACGGGSSDSTEIQSQESNSSNAATQETQNTYSGLAQKGPFAVNSDVIVEKLDSTAQVTGDVIESKISNSSGRFSYEIPTDWNLDAENDGYIQINANGFILDESTGETSSKKVNLATITNNLDDSSVNILTHWKVLRAKILVANGVGLARALSQSEEELYDLFGIQHFNQLDIFNTESELISDNALLLLLSGALMEVANRQEVDVQEIINQIGADFSAEGAIDLVGNNWIKHVQAAIRDNPVLHLNTYARNIKNSVGLRVVDIESVPDVIFFASRPSAILPSEVFAKPSETIVLDGSESHDNEEGALVNYTWFRVDQQVQYAVPFSDRFAVSPSITVPNEESELLFALVVTDVNDLTDTTVIKVIVRTPPPTNNPPTAQEQQVSTDEDSPVNISLVADDQDGDTLSYGLTTPVLLLHGLLEGTPPNLIYTPDHNFNGSDRFTFTVSDGSETSSAATVDIIVSPINDKPLAIDQALSTNEGQPITNIILSGFDVEGDSLSYKVLESPSHGVLAGSSANYSYTPDSGYNGPDGFSFVSNDGFLDSTPAIVSINVLSVNDAPVAVGDNYVTNENTSITITPLANDTDADGDPLQVSSINGSMLSGGVQSIPVSNGLVEVDISGVILFVPNSNFIGDSIFAYEVSDGKGGTATANVTIVVSSVNHAPTARTFTIELNQGDDGVPLNGVNQLNGTDPDGDDLIVVDRSEPLNNPSTGIISIQTVTVGSGSVSLLLYTPNPDFCGIDTIQYKVQEVASGHLKSAFATVTFDVNCKPIAGPVADATLLNSTLDILLEGTDSDGTIIDYKIITPPTSGEISGITTNTVFNTPNITYIPFSAPIADSFSFTVIDDKGLESDPFIVQITLPNVAPIANNATVNNSVSGPNSDPAGPISIDLADYASDPDIGDTLTYEIVAVEGLVTSDAPLSFDFTSIPTQTQIVVASAPLDIPTDRYFDYRVIDNHGNISNTARIIVRYINLPPVALIKQSIPAAVVGQPFSLTDGGSFDPFGVPIQLQWSVISSPVGAVTTLNPTPDGSLVSIEVNTSGSYTFKLTVTNDNGLSDSATITLFVSP